MKYINTIMSQNDIHENEIPMIEEFIELAERNMVKHHVEIVDESHEMMFYNHLVSLARRIITKRFIDDLDDSMFSEISKEAFMLAQDVCSDLFIHGECEVNQSEIFLVATHLQLFLETQKGGNEHE